MPLNPSAAPAGTLLGVALDDVAVAIRAARTRVLIATPFLSLPVAQLLVRAADAGAAKQKRLLTAVNVAAVEGGYLDPFAVETFWDAGFEVASLRNLHAKTVLVDDTWGLVGSGNLTVAGANGGNAELGVVLSKSQVRKARRQHFDSWWAVAEPIELEALHRLASRRPANPERRQRAGQGGLFKGSVGRELGSFSRDKRNSGYWLKVMYGSSARASRAGWRNIGWVNDAHVIRNGVPTRKPGYSIGDHLVTYLARLDGHPCPAILRVLDEPAYEPETVAAQFPGDEQRWAWVTSVELVAATDASDAPTLGDLGIDAMSVRQQGRLRLTPAQYRTALRAIRTDRPTAITR